MKHERHTALRLTPSHTVNLVGNCFFFFFFFFSACFSRLTKQERTISGPTKKCPTVSSFLQQMGQQDKCRINA